MRIAGVLAAALSLAAARPASAEWHLTPTIALTFHAKTNAPLGDIAPIGTHPSFGGAVAVLGAGIIGVEGIGVFTPTFMSDDPAVTAVVQSSSVLAIMGNVVITTPRRWTEYSLRPYVSGGFGVIHLSVTDVGPAGVPILPTKTNAPAIDIGGGAIGFFSKHTGMRFDLRYYRRIGAASQALLATDKPEVSFMTASVGVVFRR
jgi:hypothetical protein